MDLRNSPTEANVAPLGKMDAYMRLLAWESFSARRRNMTRLESYRRSWIYVSGDNLHDSHGAMPLSVNYLKLICEMHAAYLWGQWEPTGRMLSWSIKPRVGKGDQEIMEKVLDWLYTLFDGYEEILYSSGMNQSIFGDCVLTPRWDPLLETVYPESVLPEYFHCRWSPHDITRLNEVVIAYPIAREDAETEFGTKGDTQYGIHTGSFSHQYAIYWEHWTPERKDIYIDNLLIEQASGPNPYAKPGLNLPGIIPFVHVPNVRSGGEFYGTSDIDGVYDLQDEVNRRLADYSDIISYSAHPIILVKKYFGRVTDLPVGPDAIWDLGREGEAEYLSGDPPPVDIDKYLAKIQNIIEDLSALPDAAYGHNEHAERSAISLAMKMMPTTSRVTWKRLHWRTGLINYVHMAARLAEINNALPFPRTYLQKLVIDPDFAPVLPKDRSAIVGDNVQLVLNGIRSTKRALEELGERKVDDEYTAIFDDLKKKVDMGMQIQLGGKNAKGPGGSPDTGAEQRDRSQ